jgi:hypothetical protein
MRSVRRSGDLPDMSTGEAEHAAQPPARYCKARTRTGDRCKRRARPGRDYCPSHDEESNAGGRPSTLTDAVEARFLDGLRSGVGIETAAAFAELNASTLYNWLAQGDQERAAGVTAQQSAAVKFLEGVARTRAQVQVSLAAQIRRAAVEDVPGDPRMAAWMLERLAPREFGQHQVVEHEHSGLVELDFLEGRQPVDLPVETREKIVTLLEEAHGEAIEGREAMT